MDQLLASLQARADEVTEEYGIARVEVYWKTEHESLNKKTARHLGTAYFLTNRISIARQLYGVDRDEEALFETLNHELAHFVAWRLTGDSRHGRGFKKYARKLGSFARARVGTVAQEQARIERSKTAKALRAKNRKSHAAGHIDDNDGYGEGYSPTCHLCRKIFG